MSSVISTSSARRPRRPDATVALPFALCIGPYRCVVHLVPRERLENRKELCELDVNAGVVRMAQTLSGVPLARHFLKCVVRLIHYASGCQTGCIEEAFTHSLATGLVAFARGNPEAWRWFNLLLSESLVPGAAFDRLADAPRAVESRRAAPSASLRPPDSVRLRDWTVPIRILSEQAARRLGIWGDYDYASHAVRLYEGLRGPHAAVVAVHELTHVIHHRARLKNRDTKKRFIAAETDGWLRLIRDNPHAWRWLLRTVHADATAKPRRARRRGAP